MKPKSLLKEIKDLKRANKMVESFCNKLEKTNISAFNFYRAAGQLISDNANRIEALKSEIFEDAENEAEYQQLMESLN